MDLTSSIFVLMHELHQSFRDCMLMTTRERNEFVNLLLEINSNKDG